MIDALNLAELDLEGLLSREWLTANGVGGYASSTLCGLNTRRYHGLLVAAMAPPVRRMVLLSRVEETVRCNGREDYLASNEYPGAIWPNGHQLLRAFSTDPHPRWAYQGDGWTLQKELRLIRGQNTVLLSYTLLGGGAGAEIDIRPLLALRGMHELCYQWNGNLNALVRGKGNWHVPATRRTPELFFANDGSFEGRSHWYLNQIYRREAEYGYAGLEDLWSPGQVQVRLLPGKTVHFACSTDPVELQKVVELADRQRRDDAARHEWISRPTPELADPGAVGLKSPGLKSPGLDSSPDDALGTLIRATGDHLLATANAEAFGAVGQYHWSPPSVRSALAGFTGLFLIPGQYSLGRSLLATLAGQLVGGLLPNDIPTDGSTPLPRGSDVSLWYIHAVRQYLLYSGDTMVTKRQFLPAVLSIVDSYQRGTDRGVNVDANGLLQCGGPKLAATWMDHRIGDQPVTPRHGRPVEINALWYNALLSAADLCRRFERPADADHLESLAARVKFAFNAQFWNAAEDCCFDVVGDGANDASIRPNQLLAFSLPFAVLTPDRWSAVLTKVEKELLTPIGLRTLAVQDSKYKGRYTGDVVRRDAAAHNGTVYPWLLGSFATAKVRVCGASEAVRSEVRKDLAGCIRFVAGDGLGHLFELADGDAPHRPGGAIASALSIGEVVRAYYEDGLGRRPKVSGGNDNTAAKGDPIKPGAAFNA